MYCRKYSGERLCGSCFKESVVSKVRRTLSKYDMLHHGERIAVAVSGGKDSVSLLEMLSDISRDHSSTVYAVTVDEGIRGYRDEAVGICREVCGRLKVSLKVVSYRDLFGADLDEMLRMRREKVTSCTVCGTFRRRAIDVASESVGADVVATAHNLDDFLQTFYINVMNGDLERIKWLSPRLEPKAGFPFRRIKPLLEVYEEELAFYAYLSGMPFQSESCPYMNEGVRSEIRGFISSLEARHPGSKYSMLRTVLGLADGLVLPSAKSLVKCSRCGRASTGEVCSACSMVQLIGLKTK